MYINHTFLHNSFRGCFFLLSPWSLGEQLHYIYPPCTWKKPLRRCPVPSYYPPGVPPPQAKTRGCPFLTAGHPRAIEDGKSPRRWAVTKHTRQNQKPAPGACWTYTRPFYHPPGAVRKAHGPPGCLLTIGVGLYTPGPIFSRVEDLMEQPKLLLRWII